MQEFGIDIVSEDNRTIVHHKVAAKVYCVFGPDDAALSARQVAGLESLLTSGSSSTTRPRITGGDQQLHRRINWSRWALR